MSRIFIKTYFKDYFKLARLFRSLESFAKGIDKITVVSDRHYPPIPAETLNIIKSFDLDVIYEAKPKDSNGYYWQQCIKLNWWQYCEDNTCIQIDSDCFLKKEMHLNDLKLDNRWVWHYRPWGKLNTRPATWYRSTKKLLRFDPEYQAMVGCTYVLTRDCTKDFLTYLTRESPTAFNWNFILKNKIKMFSEYCLYGGYIKKIDHPEYYKKVWNPPETFKQSIYREFTAKTRGS